MAKPLQLNEEGRVTDPETQKNQKGYELYEKEQSDAQRKLEERDKRMLEGARKVKEKIKSVLPFKKGGAVKKRMRKFEGGGIAYLEDKMGMSRGADAGLGQTSRTPEERALAIGLKEGSPDFKKAVETLSKQRKSPSLPSEGITQTNENPVTKKIKDTAINLGKKIMELNPQGKVVKGALSMARKPSRSLEGESSFEQEMGMKKGGKVKSASARADGCAIRGKTRA
jgi:hypothetical protein